jgi:hypothetical protein
MKTSAIKDREIIRRQSREPLPGKVKKLGFQPGGNKKSSIIDQGF